MALVALQKEEIWANCVLCFTMWCPVPCCGTARPFVDVTCIASVICFLPINTWAQELWFSPYERSVRLICSGLTHYDTWCPLTQCLSFFLDIWVLLVWRSVLKTEKFFHQVTQKLIHVVKPEAASQPFGVPNPHERADKEGNYWIGWSWLLTEIKFLFRESCVWNPRDSVKYF